MAVRLDSVKSLGQTLRPVRQEWPLSEGGSRSGINQGGAPVLESATQA